MTKRIFFFVQSIPDHHLSCSCTSSSTVQQQAHIWNITITPRLAPKNVHDTKAPHINNYFTRAADTIQPNHKAVFWVCLMSISNAVQERISKVETSVYRIQLIMGAPLGCALTNRLEAYNAIWIVGRPSKPNKLDHPWDHSTYKKNNQSKVYSCSSQHL